MAQNEARHFHLSPQKTHIGENPFQCNQCGDTYITKYTFLKHQKIHNGDNSFRYNHCGKSFADKSDPVQHQRIHTWEKPHNGEKLFQCN